MAPKDGSQERNSTPDVVEKGMATINTLRYAEKKRPHINKKNNAQCNALFITFQSLTFSRIGVKAFVEKVGRIFIFICPF